MNINGIKLIAAASFAGIAAYFGALVWPVLLVAVVMLIDYGTGVAAAYVASTLSSRIGIVGILKKLGYLCLVAVGVAVDLVIHYAAERLGLDIGGINFFALLVAIWIIVNECISILENVAKISGRDPPAFLLKIIHRLKAATEQKGDADDA